ncbi:pimeloyl-ACP methyl ester carboxylesterase [Oxalobacteraceae bacterium GrIS 1.18]
MKTSRSEFVSIRDHQYHCRHWGNPAAPVLFMVHGWMDVSASFQFVVDSLKEDWHVIAPDLRGFGLTTGPKTDAYWFPDYMADLDALLLHYSPDAPVNLIGHSLGGNIVAIYAGVRPERIARLVVLEGFGLATTQSGQAPGRYREWLDELREQPTMKAYASVDDVARRLQKTNPRLSNERAAYLAQHWSAANADGQWEILGDPAHKISSPVLYRVEEVMACWESITAPVLWVEAADTEIWSWIGGKEKGRIEADRRLTFFKQVQQEMIQDAGHMLHHDQPAQLAEMIEQFVKQPG